MYPAYQTFKALDGKDKEARIHLLRYWAVFAAFSSVEFYTDMLIAWLPFYYELKMLILLYLSIPVTKGSATVYEMHMKPWLRAHQEEIDEAIAQARSSILSILSSYWIRLKTWAHESISGFLQDKIPAMLPLYTMLVALASETLKHLFPASSPVTSPASSLASSAADLPAPAASDAAVVADMIEPVAIVALPEAQPITAPQHVRAISTPAPSLSQIAQVSTTATKSTTSIAVEKPSARTRAALKQAEPRANRSSTSSRSSVLAGTAMPQRAARPTPATSIAKKDVITQILESDSIILTSPKKRSNPILLSSPQRTRASS